MRGLVVCLVASLSGCYDDRPGVLVEVQTDVAASRFELLLSTEHCAECTRIVPPSYTQARATMPIVGTGWKNQDLERFAIEFDEPRDTARFFLESAEDQHVKRAVIVALDGAQPQQFEKVIGVATFGPFDVPAGSSVKFEVALAPADALDSQTSNEHAELWRRKNDAGTHTACVVVQHHAGEPEFFVPADDTDCDNPVAMECDPFGYLAAGTPPSLEKANCLAADATQHCRLAGPSCSESGTSTSVCVAVAPSYCVPQAYCGSGCNLGGDLGCLTVIGTGSPYVDCGTYTDANQGPCDATGETSARLDLSELVYNAGGHCKAIKIASPRLPLAFGDEIQLTTADTSATFLLDQASFDATTCSVVVQWSGTFANSFPAILDIETDTGVHRLVPWKIRLISPTCPGNMIATMTCNAFVGSTDNTIYSCQ